MRPDNVLKHLDGLRKLPHPFNNRLIESRQMCWAYGAGCFFSSLCGEITFSPTSILDMQFYLSCTEKTNDYILNILNYPSDLVEWDFNTTIYAVKMFYRYSLSHMETAENLLKIAYKLENSPPNNNQAFGYVVKWALELSESNPDQFLIHYVEPDKHNKFST
jgi:hypothetical protein